MRHAIKASIDIQAPPEKVWEVLMEFPRYPEWSKYLLSIEGRAIPGLNLHVLLTDENGKLRTFSPVVLQVSPPNIFRWLEHLGVPGLLDREHSFTLEYHFGGHTRVCQAEEYGGFLTLFLWRSFKTSTANGFAAFNHALKKRAESRR
ncbi:MAG: SRPBCC domain-containing protein [Gammaproteobacteria bacterium]|nr:SRPBCC domain-containing protein [Gammaproteobacteria bacterium]